MPPKRQGETPPKRQIKSKHLTNVVPAATVLNLKWKWKHQCKVDGHRRADNYFQEDWWSRRCFLQAVHFLQTLSEGYGDRLTKPNVTVRRWNCLYKSSFVHDQRLHILTFVIHQSLQTVNDEKWKCALRTRKLKYWYFPWSIFLINCDKNIEKISKGLPRDYA